MSFPFNPDPADAESAFGSDMAVKAGGMSGRGKKNRKAWRTRNRRLDKIQRAAEDAARKWQPMSHPPPRSEPEKKIGFYRELPRFQTLGIPKPKNAEESALPPPYHKIVFKAGILRSLWHLLQWIRAGLIFGFAVGWDWLRGENSHEVEARRLYETFKQMGTTFIKIGQQLSMRADLIPEPYTRNLEKLLDNVDPFPFDEAKQIIEATISKKMGRKKVKLEEFFSAFDKKPIGSASVACVYQAILRTGETVAVKVRRPNVGPRLAADMRALQWITVVVEFFFTPGFLKNLVYELREMLMEELDFRREARFADLYRRRVRKIKHMHFVSVPRVFFDYSNDEVMVSEFISGYWLKDLLPAIDLKDPAATARLQKLHLDPMVLARRIQIIARFNNFENIFFHADLHPANIMVQPGNKIILIDFGSCGSFSRRELNAWRRWFDAQSVDDVGGMVQAAMAIIEPVPPIDKDEFGHRLESKFWDNLYAIKSKDADWSERITSRLWYDFLDLSRQFKIPMRLNTLRMIRASMLTDTIAGRLDHDQDPYKEFRYYEKRAGRRAKKRVIKRVHNLLGPSKYLRIEQAIETLLQLGFQVQRTVNSLAGIRIGAIIAKIDYFLSLVLKHLVWAATTFTVGVIGVWIYRLFYHDSQWTWRNSVPGALSTVFFHPAWWVIAATPVVLVLLRMYPRMQEKQYLRGSSSSDDL